MPRPILRRLGPEFPPAVQGCWIDRRECVYSNLWRWLTGRPSLSLTTITALAEAYRELVGPDHVDEVVHDDDLGPTLPGNHTSGKEA